MSSGWPTISLGEACEINIGKTPSRSNHAYWGPGEPWLSIADMSQGRLVSSTKETVTPLAVQEAVAKPVEPGTVLLSFKLSIGKVGIAQRRMYTNEAIAALPVREGVPLDSNFLAWKLSSMNLPERASRAAKGSTLNKRTLSTIEIELPPIDEQRRIAAILDRADALRDNRRATLDRLDGLRQAVFSEMFGDPVVAPREMVVVPLSEVVPTIDSGRSPTCLSRPAEEGEWGVLKLGAVTYGSFAPEENKAFIGNVEGMTAHEVRSGDLLFARKNTPELVGAAALVGPVRERLLLPDLIFRLNYDPSRIKGEYLHQLLMYPSKRAQVRALAGGSARSMSNISKAKLRMLPVEVPSLDQQEAFVRRLRAIETIEEQLAVSSKIMDDLFAALQARAFAGPL